MVTKRQEKWDDSPNVNFKNPAMAGFLFCSHNPHSYGGGSNHPEFYLTLSSNYSRVFVSVSLKIKRYWMPWIFITFSVAFLAYHFFSLVTAIILGFAVFALIPVLGGEAVESNRIAKFFLWPYRLPPYLE